MITETSTHLTELDAKSKGETFKTAWGWGYSPTFRVYYSERLEVWVCEARRYSSCD